MRVRIHRGAREVGGSCVEVESAGWRLVLDVGLPLDPPLGRPPALPDLPALADGDAKTAVFVTHGHPDHYGLAPLVHRDVAFFMSASAHRVLAESAFFTPAEPPRRPTRALEVGEPILFGPFRVLPYAVDHSAYRSQALLVEAEGHRLFYTGDLRGHGRRRWVFQKLLADPPQGIDALLMEGTHVRAADATPEPAPSEREVEQRCARLFRGTDGMALACYSPQNVDRLVTLYRAARRAGRDFVMDLYAATVAAATGNPRIPQASWRGVRVYVPTAQRQRVVASGEFERTNALRGRRIHTEELQERADELVMTFRGSMADELERIGCLDGARCVWSLWAGYLDRSTGPKLRRWLGARAVPLALIHSSGHASVGDLQRLVAAVRPRRTVPIHTWAPERFGELFEGAELHPDGEWWRV